MPKTLHLFARHHYRVGEHLVRRAGTGADLPSHRAVQRGTRRERENRVQQSRHSTIAPGELHSQSLADFSPY